ncbi:MAG: zinc ribbon domain-containing protein [Verrucomicrobiota bacterium]
MPIYEFACPRCRRIFSFLSRRLNPDRAPACPKCGSRDLEKQISRFALTHHQPDPEGSQPGPSPLDEGGPDLSDPRVARALGEMERDFEHLDENNPRHLAHMMKKMKDLLPPGAAPKELDAAIRRLEAGEDPEKVEADMGDLMDGFMGKPGDRGSNDYTRDSGLYDY